LISVVRLREHVFFFFLRQREPFQNFPFSCGPGLKHSIIHNKSNMRHRRAIPGINGSVAKGDFSIVVQTRDKRVVPIVGYVETLITTKTAWYVQHRVPDVFVSYPTAGNSVREKRTADTTSVATCTWDYQGIILHENLSRTVRSTCSRTFPRARAQITIRTRVSVVRWWTTVWYGEKMYTEKLVRWKCIREYTVYCTW
jgi:hypothetical protein